MAERALALTTRRVVEESKSTGAPGAQHQFLNWWDLHCHALARNKVAAAHRRTGLGKQRV